MKKSNKVLSLVIALIFMFSAVTPAFAISDEAGDAAATLVGLGVIEGYEDGSLGLDQTITRAEMCVVLAEMADMGAAADILADIPSTFSDVKTGVWYTGYINLAAQQGWVSGYPDGTFKPNAPVSYAEAITMMLNVLGYGEGELPGTWPLNYIVKASNLDITDDVTFSSKAPALRGDVFVMAKAALEADQVNWDKDEDSFVTDEDAGTLLAALTSGNTGSVQIDDAYMMVGSEMDDDDREVSIVGREGAVYAVADGFDIRPYVGIPTDFYLNSDDEIIAVNSTDMDDVEMGDTLEVDTCCVDLAFMDDDDDTEYDIAGDAVIVVNESVYSADGWDETFYPCEMSFILDSDDYVIYAEFVDYSDMSSGLVEDVDIDGDDVDIDTYAGSSLSVNTDDDMVMVFGAADSLADIEEFDVLYWNDWNEDSDDYALYVVRDTADGEADRYVNGDYIRVDGDKYYDGENGAYYSLDDASNFDASAEFEDYSEEDVMLYLDGCGDIYAISGDVEAVADLVALALDDVEMDSSFGDDVYRVDLYLAAGEEVTYYFEDDYAPIELVAGELVEYGLNDDGEIDDFGLYSAANDAVVATIDGDDAEDYNRLTAGGSRYYAVSDTVIFYAADMDDVELWDWDDIVDAGDVDVDGFVYGDSDRDIEYLVLTSELEGAEADFAVVVDTWSVGSDDFVGYVTLDGYAEDELGEVVDAVYEDAAYAIYFNVSDIDLTELEADYEASTLGEDAYNDSRSTITIGTTEYDIDADTLIVDTTDDDAVITASDLGEDVIDAYIDEFGYVEVIVVID